MVEEKMVWWMIKRNLCIAEGFGHFLAKALFIFLL